MPPIGLELIAPPHWRCIDFLSDLHLQASEVETSTAWKQYLARTPANALFVLGDLFEVWVGDDAASDPTGFEAQCLHALQQASLTRSIYFICGNRDFLLGSEAARSSGMQLLADPTVLAVGGERWLLSHGDALCLDDKDYQIFRSEVRTKAWAAQFLSQPLLERQQIARKMRSQSEAQKRAQTVYADLDVGAVEAWLLAANAQGLVHGHTHKPGDHLLPSGGQRRVLSDWDLGANPPRAEILRLEIGPATETALSWHRLTLVEAVTAKTRD